MKKFFSDFKKFISQGNVVDMAVGIIIGTAFKDIVNSFVSDLVMPTLGLAIGKFDFNTLVWSPYPGVSIPYGKFLDTVVNFFVIAFCIFLALRVIAKLREKAESEMKRFIKKEEQAAEQEQAEASPEPLSTTDQLLTDIKLLLEQQNSAQE